MNRRYRKLLVSLLARVAEPGPENEAIIVSDEVRSWPADALDCMIEAKLIKEHMLAESIPCRGCEERCLRPAEIVADIPGKPPFALLTCHLLPNIGPFERDIGQLRRWAASRELISRFFGRQIGLKPNEWDGHWRRIRYGLFPRSKPHCLLSLEFDGTARVRLGTSSFDLMEFIDWGEQGIHVDQGVLTFVAQQSSDLTSGSKRTQPSDTIREDCKAQTVIRDRRLQRKFDQLAKEHPRLNKEALAKVVAKSGDFPGMSWSRIARVTKMPPK